MTHSAHQTLSVGQERNPSPAIRMDQNQPQLNASFYQEDSLPQNINTDNEATDRFRPTPQVSSISSGTANQAHLNRQGDLHHGSEANQFHVGYLSHNQSVSDLRTGNVSRHISDNQRVRRTMFSPQPRPTSPLSVSHSPASKKLKNDTMSDLGLQGSPNNINFYVLTERGGDRYNPTVLRSSPRTANAGVHQKHNSNQSTRPTRVQSLLNQPDEDERFLQLAREALVATATGANLSNSQFVDPTISDLLTRLQYALLPHGNPIKKSTDIETNVSGRLNILGFYKNFPNLSNDIFTDHANLSPRPAPTPQSSNHPSLYNEGWNFLIGESVPLKTPKEREAERQMELANRLHYKQYDSDDDDGDGDDGDDERDNDPSFPGHEPRKNSAVYSDDPLRKFLCSKCLMSFRRSSDLKRHEKQHLSIPPNICELCGKGFARKDALKRHVSTLTCKRNAEKKLYVENLNYLSERKA